MLLEAQIMFNKRLTCLIGESTNTKAFEQQQQQAATAAASNNVLALTVPPRKITRPKFIFRIN